MMMPRRQSFINDTSAMLLLYLFVAFTTMTRNFFIQGAGGNTMNIGSPCPSVFQYNWDGLEWYGTIIAPSLPYGTSARLIAQLSINRVLPTKYAGTLELIGPRSEVLNAMLTEQPIRYKVNFPLPHPLPLVTAITLNDRLICSGPAVIGPIVTSITLEHTLYPQQGKILNSRGRLPPQQIPAVINVEPLIDDTTDSIITNQHRQLGVFKENNFSNNNNNHNNVRDINNQNNNHPFMNGRDETRFNTANINNNRELNQQNDFITSTIFDNNNNNESTFPITMPMIINNKRVSTIEKNILANICGSSVRITPLIANGEMTKRRSYPWLAALFAQKSLGLEFTCGGTLISARYVITAAHCIRYGENRALTPDEIVIVLGKYRIRHWTEHGSVFHDAARIILHPEYRALSGDADLAAIELTETVTFTDTIRPVCIWYLQEFTNHSSIVEDLIGVEALIVGWGRDETGLKVTPEPRQARVRIVSQEDCLRSRLEFRYITSNRTFCAGGINPGSGPCSGDSGGGLFVKNEKDEKWYLRGVISMSLADPVTKSCDLKHYSVFVDIGKFYNWINQFINY